MVDSPRRQIYFALFLKPVLNQNMFNNNFNKDKFYLKTRRFATSLPRWHICSALFSMLHNNLLTSIGFSTQSLYSTQFISLLNLCF